MGRRNPLNKNDGYKVIMSLESIHVTEKFSNDLWELVCQLNLAIVCF